MVGLPDVAKLECMKSFSDEGEVVADKNVGVDLLAEFSR